MRHDAHAGSLQVDVRAYATCLAQLVADRVFELERAELTVRYSRVDAGKLTGQRSTRVDVRAPIERACPGVIRIGISSIEIGNFQQHPARHP